MDIKVLIDTPLKYPNKKGKWSHLVCNDLDHLHVFAQNIGIPRARFQNKRKKNKRQPHYDVPISLYSLAVQMGAIPVSRKEGFLFLEEHFN